VSLTDLVSYYLLSSILSLYSLLPYFYNRVATNSSTFNDKRLDLLVVQRLDAFISLPLIIYYVLILTLRLDVTLESSPSSNDKLRSSSVIDPGITLLRVLLITRD
jgi:hypothetical protein